MNDKGISLTLKGIETLNNPEEMAKMPLDAQKFLMAFYIAHVSPELLETTISRLKDADQEQTRAVWNEYFERLVLDNLHIWEEVESEL